MRDTLTGVLQTNTLVHRYTGGTDGPSDPLCHDSFTHQDRGPHHASLPPMPAKLYLKMRSRQLQEVSRDLKLFETLN